MLYGLKIAHTTVQHVMEVILTSVKWQLADVYLNVKVIFSRTPPKHVNHTLLILSSLKEAGITLKLKK